MGSIQTVKGTRGNTYRVLFRDPTGKSQSKTFKKKKEAAAFLHDTERAKNTGAYVSPSAGRVKFEARAEKVLHDRSIRVRESTQARDATLMRSLVLPTFADRDIGAIARSEVQAWAHALARDGKAPATIQKAYQLLALVFADAIADEVIIKPPCHQIKLPKPKTGKAAEKRFLTLEELDQLADAIHPHYRQLLFTAAHTGLRFGELAGLRVADKGQGIEGLDLIKRELRVVNTLNDVGGRVWLGPPKTEESIRTIKLSDTLVEQLARHLEHHDGEYVFMTRGGPSKAPSTLRRNNFRNRHFRPAVLASVGEPMTFHNLRDTHCALLISLNTHPSQIAARLGHTDVATVLRVYGHLYEKDERAVADEYDALLLSVE